MSSGRGSSTDSAGVPRGGDHTGDRHGDGDGDADSTRSGEGVALSGGASAAGLARQQPRRGNRRLRTGSGGSSTGEGGVSDGLPGLSEAEDDVQPRAAGSMTPRSLSGQGGHHRPRSRASRVGSESDAESLRAPLSVVSDMTEMDIDLDGEFQYEESLLFE